MPAQSSSQTLPTTPRPQGTPSGDVPDGLESIGFFKVVCGGGAATTAGAPSQGVGMCGGSFNMIFLDVEAGILGPQGGSTRAYLSADAVVPLRPLVDWHGNRPYVLAGYTRVFGYSNDVDFGIGLEHKIGPHRSLEFEVRDYAQFLAPAQHAPMLRVQYVFGGPV